MAGAAALVACALASPAAAPAALGDVAFESCVASAGGSGCSDPSKDSLDGARGVAVSPDGASIYAAARLDQSITHLTRGSAGAPAFESCVSGLGVTQCSRTGGNALSGPRGVAVSPDGKSVYVVSEIADSVTHFTRDPSGSFAFHSCEIQNAGSGCADANGMNGPQSVAVSPDGKSVYVASSESDTVAHFTRGADGGLTFASCIGGGSLCGGFAGSLLGASAVTVSPDGGSVYVAAAGDDAITRFPRQANGALTPGRCVANDGASGCANPPNDSLDGASGVAVSPDGNTVYVAADADDSITLLDASTAGALTFSSCVAEGGASGCADPPVDSLNGARGVAVSPDGASVYVASLDDDSITQLQRGPGGGLAFASCIAELGASGCTDPPTDSLDRAHAVAVSPDGDSVYVASEGDNSITHFTRATPPAPPAIADTDPDSPANDTSPQVKGSAEPGSTVRIYGSADCSGQPLATGPAAGFATPGLTASVSANSTTALRATATDAAGSTSACSAPFDYREDSTAPDTTIVSGPQGPTNDSTPTFAFFSSEPDGARFECRVDFAGFAPCSSPLTVAPLDDGTHTFAVRAVDRAGNPDQSPAARVVVVDTVAPGEPRFGDTDPDSPANHNQPRLKGQAEGTVFVYRNSACSGVEAASGTAAQFAGSGIQVSVGDDSQMTFHAKAVDAAGNASACSADSITYVEDSASPAAPAVTGTDPESPANDTTPQVRGSAEPGSTVRIYASPDCGGAALATGPAADFAGPGLSASAADNATTGFRATATDAAGNTSACSAPFAYTVDSSAPAAPVITATDPASPANASRPKVRGNAEGGDPGSISRQSTDVPKAIPDNGVAESTLELTRAGTIGDVEVRIDSLQHTFDADLRLELVAPDGTVVTLSNRRGISGRNFTNTVFDDEAGQAIASGAAPFTGAFRPDTSLAALDGRELRGTWTLRIHDLQADDVGTLHGWGLEITLDSAVELYANDAGCDGPPAASGTGAAFAAGGIPLDVPDDTTTEIRATVTDPAGNTSACSAPFAYREDSTAPDTTIASGPEGPTNDSTPTFAFSSSEPDDGSFECRVGSGDFAPCTSPYTAESLGDGEQRFEVRAVDAAGNRDESAAARSFTLDTMAPAAPAIAATNPASPAGENRPAVRGAAEEGSTVKLYGSPDCGGEPLAEGRAIDFAAPGLTVSVDDDSTTTFRATATDAAGNISPCSAGLAYFERTSPPPAATPDPGASAPAAPASPAPSVQEASAAPAPDADPPETAIDRGPRRTTTNKRARFAFSSDEAGVTYECSFDRRAFRPCSSPLRVVARKAGRHTFAVRAVDAAGNADPTPARKSWKLKKKSKKKKKRR